VLVEAVEEMRQMSDDMSVRQGRFEEVARESVRQEPHQHQEVAWTSEEVAWTAYQRRLRPLVR
jgi:hypothetical protein